MDQIVNLQMEIHEVKEQVKDIVDSTSKLALNDAEYWDNANLTPNNSSVASDTKTKFYLNQAQDNGTLDQIHNYHEPLAFTVKAKAVKGIIGQKKWYCNFYVWDASRLSFLSKEGEIKSQTRNHNKFEVWTEDGKSDKTTEFQNNVMDKIADLE